MHVSVSQLDQAAVKALIDAHIRYYCDERKHQAANINQRYALLWETINALLLAGGKRFRPYMMILAFTAYSPNSDPADILPAAIAQELLHSAMLIHDDIIDRDTVRYGVKNISGQYETLYQPLIAATDERAHMSLSAALLAGDILLTDAHRLLRTVRQPEELINQATDILSHGIFEVIGGELLDSEAAILPAGSISAEQIAKHKTASYSFVSPLTMGATLAGASTHELHLLTQLSEYLGIGYQFCDDLLGVFGDEKSTGKSTSTDLIEGKRTIIIEQFDVLANDTQKARFYALFHKAAATEEELTEARQLLVEAGAKNAVIDYINALHSKANTIIEQLSINDAAKATFYDLVSHCLERDS